MARRKIPSDTSYFHYINVNPKNLIEGDCVVRAISRATGLPWKKVYTDLTIIGAEMCRMPNSTQVYDKYLQTLGFVKNPAPKKPDNHKYRGKEFCEEFFNKGVCVMHIGGHHMSCVINGVINDTWNCSGGSIGNYWVRPNNWSILE